MRPAVEERLLEINREFYRRFAADFAATRGRLQPGVRCALERLRRDVAVLDLGCGHGAVARELAARGFVGRYLGMDASPALLKMAREAIPRAVFVEADLASADWASLASGPFDAALAFAVLHHLPGAARRRDILQQVRRQLARGGELTISTWRFLHSPRLAWWIVPWEAVGLTADDVDAGDFLVDWRRGGRGLRYVHHFAEGEVEALAEESGFEVIESFVADGREGRLGAYNVLRRLEVE